MRAQRWRSSQVAFAPNGGVATAPPPPSPVAALPRAKSRRTAGLTVVYTLWFIVFLDPQWWIANSGPEIVLKVPTVIFGLLAVLILSKGPKGEVWFPALFAMLAFAALTLPLAISREYAMKPTKQLLLYYILAVGTLTFVRDFARAWPILALAFLFQYVWWAGLGAKSGLVYWHPTNANWDGFGPLMVMGIASTFYFGMATKSKRLKKIAFATTVLCLIGLVSTFARGAVLSAGAVLGYAWIRTPRKGFMTAGIVLAVVVVTLASFVFFDDTRRGRDSKTGFWTEMATIGQEEEGGTEDDRKALWSAAWIVFKRNPIIGVGKEGFGPYAAHNLKEGEVKGEYAANPLTLFDRKLHSTYFQILSEEGIIGLIVFISLLVDFWRRNNALRTPAFAEGWIAGGGGQLQLRWLSLGIESVMVAFLSTAFFYNQLDVNWLYSTVVMNALVYYLAKPATQRRAATGRALTA